MICGSWNSYLKFSHPYESDNNVYKDAEIQMLFLPDTVYFCQILAQVEESAVGEWRSERQHMRKHNQSHSSAAAAGDSDPGM